MSHFSKRKYNNSLKNHESTVVVFYAFNVHHEITINMFELTMSKWHFCPSTHSSRALSHVRRVHKFFIACKSGEHGGQVILQLANQWSTWMHSIEHCPTWILWSVWMLQSCSCATAWRMCFPETVVCSISNPPATQKWTLMLAAHFITPTPRCWHLSNCQVQPASLFYNFFLGHSCYS